MKNIDYYINKIRDIIICISILYSCYTINNILYKIKTVSDDIIKTREEITSIKEYILSPRFNNDVENIKSKADTVVNKIHDIKKNIMR